MKLFEQTHRGLYLTKADVTKAKNAMQEDESVIRIGTSPVTPAQTLVELWLKIHEHSPHIKFQLIPFDNTPMADFFDCEYKLNSQSYNFCVKINANTIEHDATNTSNFVMSTITHEFGHVFRLCDNPSTSMASIMKYSRNRNTMTGPQQFDIRNVNNIYK